MSHLEDWMTQMGTGEEGTDEQRLSKEGGRVEVIET